MVRHRVVVARVLNRRVVRVRIVKRLGQRFLDGRRIGRAVKIICCRVHGDALLMMKY
jgi:hypothetical protein